MSSQLPPDLEMWAVIGTDLEAVDGDLANAASTFRLPNGAVTAVIGPNGSGKSTLLNLIAGLLSASRPPAAGCTAINPENSKSRRL